MPVLTMPDGLEVDFPDDMPREVIRDKILKRYPDAPRHQGLVGQIARGGAQGVAGTVMDVAGILPQIPFLGGELPGLPEYAKQARRQATKETEKFVNEPSEGLAQNAGKVVGGALPFMAAGPAGIIGGGMKTGLEAVARNAPAVTRMGGHALGHVLGVPPWLKWLHRAAVDWAASHPGVAAAGAKIAPTAGKIGERIGNTVESRVIPLGGSTIRQSYREPVQEPPPKLPKEKKQGRGDREDRE